MSSVTINIEQGDSYTWSTSPFLWGSLYGSKSWDTANISNSTITVIEDGIIFNEFTKRVVNKVDKTILVMGEKSFKNITKIENEYLYISETYTDIINFILKILDNISFSENNFKTITVPKMGFELFNLSETFFKDITKTENESINFSELVSKEFVCVIKDLINMVELVQKMPTMKKLEVFGIIDSVKPTFNINKVSMETLNFIEFYSDLIGFHLAISEVLNFAEKTPNNYTSVVKETILLDDIKNYRNFIKTIYQELNTIEIISNNTVFKRTFSEIFNTIEKVSKQFGMNEYETFQVLDSYLRHANAVLSDLSISTIELTIDNFETVLSPIGYTIFQDFQTGNYSYKNAIIKSVLEAGINSDRPNIDKWELSVDLPDISDRGSVRCLPISQPLFIPFNRIFHIPPEVIIQIKSGGTETSRVYINSITKEGFIVEFKDGSEYIDGYISWSAEGY